MSQAERFGHVPLQGAYVARSCPVAPQWAADTSLRVVEVPRSEAEQARGDAGIQFERDVFKSIVASYGDAVVEVEYTNRHEMQAATTDAMNSGARIILGGWLPDDARGRRTGRPDVLLRMDTGWVPVDVKHHIIGSPDRGGRERRSELDDIWPGGSTEVLGVAPSIRAGADVLQLAHYWRLLEARGQAADSPLGGIIGSDGGVWWFNLTDPRWRLRTISALDLYDREFRLRLEVVARQMERNVDVSVAPLVIPLRKAACPSCMWRQVCGHQLAEADSVSLLPGMTWPNALRLIRHGVTSRSDLARLDWDTASLMHGGSSRDAGVNVAEILALADGADSSTELSEILGKRKKTRLARLAKAGMTTVGDLTRLDGKTAALSGLKIRFLPGLIDQARAVAGGGAYRARGVDQVVVPRADVEVDVDMESTAAGVYLWGTWTRVEGRGGDYKPFVEWRPLDDTLESDLFARFWAWMMDLRDRTVERGETFAAFCFSDAENTQMRRITETAATSGPTREAVEGFIGSSAWVDLRTVAKRQIVTGTNLGLKRLARMAGFGWRDDDPGGDQSMVWYERAVNHPDPAVRDENRVRLLRYNEDDVRATAAVRVWLSQTDFPPIAEAVP